MSGPAGETPELELQAGSLRRSFVLCGVYGAFLFAIMFGSMRSRAFEGLAAYLPAAIRSLPMLGYWVWVVGVCALLVGWIGLICYYEPRMGRVRFFADRVELHKYVFIVNPRGDVHAIPWTQVAGYDDSATSHVRIVRSPAGWFDRFRMTIPTPTEDGRTRVLAALERRGLRRSG